MSDDKKQWEKPWSPQEIAENASNWSFAADLSLLKYLEVFSEDLLSRAATVDNNVNTLLCDLSKASLSLDIAKNQFLSLSNTQFIESRVYEDDETMLSNEDKIEKEDLVKSNTEEFNKNEMRLAALRGIEVIEEFFDKVEVVDSDSEEDSDLTSFVLQPKDPYINRPLPYVIGSEKWHKKLHVGLDDSSSESENEKVMENFSDTDSESDLPITNRSQAKSISGSESSEADFSNKLDQALASSTLTDANRHEDSLGISEEYNSVAAQAPISQNSFAEQLAVKLGNVIKNTVEEPQINTKPIQEINNSSDYRNFFSDEPPPLDAMSDEFSPKLKEQGIFSGGDGLFDDLNDDEPFWGVSVDEKPKKVLNIPAKPIDNLFEDENEDIVSNLNKNDLKPNGNEKLKKELEEKLNKKKKPSIFDEDFESDEDSLFGKSFKTSKKSVSTSKESQNLFADDDNKSLSSQSKKESRNVFEEETLYKAKDNNANTKQDSSLFDDENSAMSNDSSEKKAPIGGIKVINNPNLFSGENIRNILKNRPQSSSESENESPLSDEARPNANVIQNKVDSKKSEERTDKIDATSIEDETKSNNLFDTVDIEDDLFKDDLFSNFTSKTKSSNLFEKSEGLFDDLEESDDETPTVTKNDEDNTKKSEGKMKRDIVKVKPGEMFDRNEDILTEGERRPVSKGDIEKKTKETRSIFSADEESDSDDLFSSNHSKIISKTKIIEDVPSVKSESKKVPSLTNPPQSVSTRSVEKKVPSLFDDDGDIDEDLFHSNYLPSKRPTPTTRSMRPEQNAPLPRRKNLFDEDDMFPGLESSNTEEKHTKSANSDNRISNSTCDPVPPVIQSGSSSNGEETLFDSNIKESSFKPAKKDKAVVVDDPFFKDQDLEEDLFGSQSHKVNDEKSLKFVESNAEKQGIIETVEENTSARQVEEEVAASIEDSNKSLDSNLKDNALDDHNVPPLDDLVSVNEESNNEDKMVAKPKENIEAMESIRSIPSKDAIPPTNIVDPEIDEGQIQNIHEELQDNHSSTIETLSIKNTFSSTFDSRIPSLNIFDPDPPSDPDDWEDRSEQNIFGDDLYSFDNTDNFVETKSSIFDREPPSPTFNVTGDVKDPKSRLVSSTNEESRDDGSPGKLKHNLNINVFALLPGAGKPPKSDAPIFPKPPPRSISLDLDSRADETFVKPPPREDKVKREANTVTSGKIQNNLDDVEVLESITKSRARGPVKRRPSTKRGRDAIRNSFVDLTFASSPTNEDHETEEKETTESSTSENSSYKNELQAKLIQNSRSTHRQVSYPPAEKASVTTTLFKEQHIKSSEEVRSINLSRSEEISTTISTKSSPTTEEVPKILIETSNIPEKTSPITSDLKPHDIVNSERMTKVEIKPDNVSKFAEMSYGRIPRINLIQQSKSNQSERESKSLFESEITKQSTEKTEDEPKPRSETSHRLRRMDFSSDLMAGEDDTFKFGESPTTKSSLGASDDVDASSETSASSRKSKRLEFLNDLMSGDFDKNHEKKDDQIKTVTTTSQTKENTENFAASKEETSHKEDILEKSSITTSVTKNTEDVFKKRTERSRFPPRKLDLFGDDLDDDDDLFSSAKSNKKNKAKPNFLSIDSGGDSDLFDVNRRSSFVKTDNFASPEFIKDDLSEDEENGDIFSEKKLPPKSDIFKRSSFADDDDDDDEDLLEQTSMDKKKASTTTSIANRRLKVSSLKKLENVTVTGDDPLNALEK